MFENSMKVLTIEFDYPCFAIGIVDDWTDVVYYYNSGKGKKDVEIRGNVFPKHMVSENIGILSKIIEDFMKTGRPSKRVLWKKQ